jgi:hypothetical protein
MRLADGKEDQMSLPLGWLLFLGGIIGAFRVLVSKTFSWVNDVDLRPTEEDRKREVPMTPRKRWILILICVTAIVIGAFLIQRWHEWNPFHPESDAGPRVITNQGLLGRLGGMGL